MTVERSPRAFNQAASNARLEAKESRHSRILSHFFTDAQKGFPTRPEAQAEPEAYPRGYVEDCAKPRTTLETFFSIRLEEEVALRHRQHRNRIAFQQDAVRAHLVRFRIDLDLR